MKKRIIVLLALTILIFSLFAFDALADEDMPDLSKVQNVYVYNLENDNVLYSKNPDHKIYPASTAKMMTGILAVEHYHGDYDHEITVTKDALGTFKGKNTKLKEGEIVTVENLLYAVICGGYNDAANVIAYEIAGSHEVFVNIMNQKAEQLGMKNTHYTNAHGYSDPDMYTTAEDTAILAKYGYLISDYMEICGTVRYTIPETNMSKYRFVYNSNYLVATNAETKYRNKEVKGINAGSTVEGGHVVVTAVSKNGMTNIFVLMGGQSDEENIYSYIAANEMIKWAYKSFEYKKIVDSAEMICEVDVRLSSQVDYVVLSPEKTLEYFLPSSVNVEKDIKRTIELESEVLDAPLEAGYVAGTMTLTYEGQEIGKVNLVTKNNVDRNGFLYLLARIQNFTKSTKFKIILICVGAALLLYVAMLIYRKTRSNRYRYRYGRYRRR